MDGHEELTWMDSEPVPSSGTSDPGAVYYTFANAADTHLLGLPKVALAYSLTGEEIEQPANLVILAAYGLSNVHLMLLSGIGKPYDPATQTGVIGKNYAYQGGANVTLFFEGKNFNPFIAAGGWGTSIDDFHTNWNFDRGKHGYIGGSYISVGGSHGRPITSERDAANPSLAELLVRVRHSPI